MTLDFREEELRKFKDFVTQKMRSQGVELGPEYWTNPGGGIALDMFRTGFNIGLAYATETLIHTLNNLRVEDEKFIRKEIKEQSRIILPS